VEGLAVLGLLTLVLLYKRAGRLLAARKDRGLIAQREEADCGSRQEKAKAKGFLICRKTRARANRSQFLNDLFRRKAFSWTQVFEDLEQVMPARLHLVSIQPAMTRHDQLEIKMVVAGEFEGACARTGTEDGKFAALPANTDPAGVERTGRQNGGRTTCNLISAPCMFPSWPALAQGASRDPRRQRRPQEGEDCDRSPGGGGHRRSGGAAFPPLWDRSGRAASNSTSCGKSAAEDARG